MLAFKFGQLVAQMTKKAAGPMSGGAFDDSPFHGAQTPWAPRGPAWARGTDHHHKLRFDDPAPARRTATPPAPSWQTTMQPTIPGMPAKNNVLADLGPNQPAMAAPSFATYAPTNPRNFGTNVANQIASSDLTAGDPGLDNGLSPDAVMGRDMANAQLNGNTGDLILPSPQGGVTPQQPKQLVPNVMAAAKPFSANKLNGQNAPLPAIAPTQLGGGGAAVKLPPGIR